jgi:hypothetical protein
MALGLISCVDEEMSMSDLSKQIGMEREIAIPLIRGSLSFEDITGTTFDSLLISNGDTIKLYLVQDIGFDDTLAIGDLGENMDFEYIYLHHRFTNMFPVGLDLNFYLYDSIQAANIDTIFFSSGPGELFLPPAPVDNDGMVVLDEVVTNIGVIVLEDNVLDNLFTRATHLVIVAEVPSTSGFVKILDSFSLSMKMGIEAKGYFETDLDSND